MRKIFISLFIIFLCSPANAETRIDGEKIDFFKRIETGDIQSGSGTLTLGGVGEESLDWDFITDDNKVAVDTTTGVTEIDWSNISLTDINDIAVDSISAADGTGPIPFNHPISVGGTNERISGTTYGEYVDFKTLGDGHIGLYGASGSDNTSIAVDLDGTEPTIYSPTDDKIALGEPEIKLQTTVPTNSAVESGYLKQRVYKDDTFADDEVMPLSMGEEVEIISNPGLEGTYTGSGTLYFAPNWTNNNLDAGVDTASEETTIIHGGSSSQYVISDADSEGIYQIQVITENKYYRASAWVYIPSGGVGGTVKLSVQENGGGYNNYVQETTVVQDMWVRLGADFQDTDATAEAKIRVYSAGGAAEFYADDVSLVEITPTSGFGQASCGDEHMMFSWETDGSVNITGTGTTNTAATNSDTDFCVYDGGYTPYLKNRLGASKEMRCVTWYN